MLAEAAGHIRQIQLRETWRNTSDDIGVFVLQEHEEEEITRRATKVMEAEIQQPWLSMNCNAHLPRRRCDVPNPLFQIV